MIRLSFFLSIVSLLLAVAASAQNRSFRTYTFREMDLRVSVPASWTHNGMVARSKAEFIRSFGRTYDKPDGADLWNAFSSFIDVDVDSTRLPAEAAYHVHRFTIVVERASTWLKQWLCRWGKRPIWTDRLVLHAGARLIEEEVLRRSHLPAGLPGAFGKRYVFETPASPAITVGHVLFFPHEQRCYELRLESTSDDPQGSTRLQRQVLEMLALMPD